MRGGLTGLTSPVPMLPTLPAIFQSLAEPATPPFLERFCDALDAVLAPVVATLDCLPAYLDVGTAPPDFLPWLAGWAGLPPSQARGDGATRSVLRATALHQGWQGTAPGIAQAVESVSGLPTEVEDTGGVSWSTDPDAPPRLPAPPEVTVRVRAGDGQDVDLKSLEALVATLTPVHVTSRVIVGRGVSDE